MDRKWRKNELPKSKKYCTWLRNFNENFTKMLRMYCIQKCIHSGSVSREFQIACFA
ncbi:hypothetical protein T11_15670, partial [Trichinella zimbabwensis]